MNFVEQVEKWGVFEVSLPGPTDGNPFVDQVIKGVFTGAHETVEADGFYDGEGVYRVRFMPSFEGQYTFAVSGSFLAGEQGGSFFVTPPQEGNHGPVRVANTFHFAYEDGEPYFSVGTTCYVWELQSDELIEQTLETLKKAPFNKIRFCIFPKHYDYNFREPRSYPYEGTPMDSSVLSKDNFFHYIGPNEGNDWDFYRFNVEYFRHIEKSIQQLGELGIEADLIVMHPYDRWGFSFMTADQDDLYWNYVIARFSAYRNVWWSLANEYDIMEHKTIADWERYAKIIVEKDPYSRLRSIHNCRYFYDYTRPWITHCSIQRQDIYKTAEHVNEWRERYQKPIVLDEIVYEGNIQHGWGNITGEEMVRRFWEATCRGAYAGHGETYMSEDDILWWSHGGKLRSDTYKRLAFLHEILCQTPGVGLAPYTGAHFDEVAATVEGTKSSFSPVKDYYLYYYSFMRPSFREYYFDDHSEYELKVIDTWDMTVEDRGIVKGHFRVALPGKQYMAIQLRRVAG